MGKKYISLLDSEEKEYVRDFFGGLCADFFPCTAKCLEETVSVTQQDGLRMVTGDDRENGWVDGIFLKEGLLLRRIMIFCRLSVFWIR